MYEKKRTSAELKQLAREALIGRYGIMAAASALMIALNVLSVLLPDWIFPGYSILSQIGRFAASVVIALLVSLFGAGYARLALDAAYGQKPPFGNMLYPFFHHPDRFLLAYLILTLIQTVLQIPVYLISNLFSPAVSSSGTMALDEALSYLTVVLLCSSISTFIYVLITLRFAMTTYLLLDYDAIGPVQSLKESAQLMKGHKGRYFYLSISFFGVLFLGFLTCGIGFLWTMPYMETTIAFFYRDLKQDIAI